MLNQQQIRHFRTFGFVVLPGLLGPGRTQALRAEVDAAIRDAYATTYDERVIDGISGHYLPMASRFTPVSASLICDDSVLIGTAEALPELRAYQRAGYVEVPGVVVESRPGDVVPFDLHTFHASFGGRDRLAWTIEYLALPRDDASRAKAHRWMDGSFEQGFRGFDRQRSPAWRDWRENPTGHRRRAAVIERLRAAGVLDLRGAEMGW